MIQNALTWVRYGKRKYIELQFGPDIPWLFTPEFFKHESLKQDLTINLFIMICFSIIYSNTASLPGRMKATY